MTLRHSCQTHGCYIKEQTPDWGFLDNAFTGRIRVGDIDGIVEANGHLLIMEWKGEGVPIPKGQEIMFKNASQYRFTTFFVINGDANRTVSSKLKIFCNGKEFNFDQADNSLVFDRCQVWEKWARNYSTKRAA